MILLIRSCASSKDEELLVEVYVMINHHNVVEKDRPKEQRQGSGTTSKATERTWVRDDGHPSWSKERESKRKELTGESL